MRQLYDNRVMELETALAAAEALRAEEVAELEAELEVARGSQAQLLSELEESLTATSAQYEATLKVCSCRKGVQGWHRVVRDAQGVYACVFDSGRLRGAVCTASMRGPGRNEWPVYTRAQNEATLEAVDWEG